LMPRASAMAEEALKLLAAHELYVAGFYFDRGNARAAIGRLSTLLRTYPGSGREPEALHMLGESYLRIGDRKSARRAFEELVARYPHDDLADDAHGELAELGG